MRPYKIKYATNSDRDVWDEYVRKHPHVGPFHMFGWREVIHRTYGHATYYLMVVGADPVLSAPHPSMSSTSG